MKTFVIANPKAAGGRVARKWGRLYATVSSSLGDTTVRFTGHQGHATELARNAIGEGYERIVVVGGDGTLNEVVNGFFDDQGEPINPEIVLAVVPAGTGGDFARSIGMRDISPEDAFRTATVRCVDTGIVRCGGADGSEQMRHFINIASFGATGLITDRVNSAAKTILRGKASYFFESLVGLSQYKNQRVRLRVDDHFEKVVSINSVAVANGRYFGGSMKVAPDAMIDDGLLDVVIIGDLSATEFLRHNKKIYAGTHLSLEEVSVVRGKKVIAEPVGTGDVCIEADGERPGNLPATFELRPQSVKLWAPWDRSQVLSS